MQIMTIIACLLNFLYNFPWMGGKTVLGKTFSGETSALMVMVNMEVSFVHEILNRKIQEKQPSSENLEEASWEHDHKIMWCWWAACCALLCKMENFSTDKKASFLKRKRRKTRVGQFRSEKRSKEFCTAEKGKWNPLEFFFWWKYKNTAQNAPKICSKDLALNFMLTRKNIWVCLYIYIFVVICASFSETITFKKVIYSRVPFWTEATGRKKGTYTFFKNKKRRKQVYPIRRLFTMKPAGKKVFMRFFSCSFLLE